MSRVVLETEQKALEINLDDKIYGSFAEIGAGQEVARFFFSVGAAVGTIAKSMSAYDKTYSDCIYGVENSGRYVCESRIYKMLDHEMGLLNERLRETRPNTNFFVFADSVAAINYRRTIKGHGWLGLRFQLGPDQPPSDVILHVKMKDRNNLLQQQAIGILGVNLVWGCYKLNDQPEQLVKSLMDHLDGRVEIDMVRFEGPDFEHLDNRLLSLYLVKNGLSPVAIFDQGGKNLHASEFLYKKDLLIVRGSYRPVTKINLDMLASAEEQFKTEERADKVRVLAEITLDNLTKDGELNEQDFLDRTSVLGELGYKVIISNCKDHDRLLDYFGDYKIIRLALVFGVLKLKEVIHACYEENKDGRLISAFGKLFDRSAKLFIYPAQQQGSGEPLNASNLEIPEQVKFLYHHLCDSGQIEDLEKYDASNFYISSTDALTKLRADEDGWEEMVPANVAELIRDRCLYGFPCERKEFKY